jgi:DNA repair protein RecO (recombination protein O)
MAIVSSTRGIVLKSVKYGETSLIVTMYTALYGLQAYLVNGVRTFTKKGPGRAALFQPAAILDLTVYHNELKNLQRIREFRWAHLYQHIYSSVFKNAVALFMVELMNKLIRQPEKNPDLFDFAEDSFLSLDDSGPAVVANFPLFFALHLAEISGFLFADDYTDEKNFLDLQEGKFINEQPVHPYFLAGTYSLATSQLIQARHPSELSGILLNQETRRVLLAAYSQFFTLHVPDFGIMKTLPVLQEVLS